MTFFEYMTAKQVMERWNLKPFELYQVVKNGLDCYLGVGGGLGYQKSSIATMLDFNDPDVAHDHMVKEINERLPTFFFKVSGVEAFENEHPELIQDDSVKGKDAQELGRLRKYEEKWDAAIEAAVEAGLWVAELWAKNKTKITKPKLIERLEKYDLPDTVIAEKIWKAIPDKYRSKGGRPKKS